MTEAEWLKSVNVPRMIAALNGKGSERLWRLLAVASVRRVEHLLRDPRSRVALAVAEQYAEGVVTVRELDAARAQAEEAAHEAAYEEYVDEVRANFLWDAEYEAVCKTRQAAYAVLPCLAADMGGIFESEIPINLADLLLPDMVRELFGNPFQWKLTDPA